MKAIYDFLRECGVFYVLTMDDGFPMGRPFGAVMEHEGKLYISTANSKNVYKQICENGKVCIVAKEPESRAWIRIKGIAEECRDIELKEKMMETCPILSKRYPSAECEYFAIFGIKVISAAIHTDAGIEKLI